MKPDATDFEKRCREAAQRIGHKTPEAQSEFVRRVVYANTRYLELKSVNPRRSTPSQQEMRLNAFHAAIQKLLTEGRALHRDSTAKAKFYKSLRADYATQPAAMKEMLAPYVTAEGYIEGVLEQFLELLSATTKNAAGQNVGYAKADLKKEFLIAWLIAVRTIWPTGPSIKFGLGDHQPGTQGGRISASLDIIHSLAQEIEPKIRRTYLGNLMKEVIKKKPAQPPAFFLWIF